MNQSSNRLPRIRALLWCTFTMLLLTTSCTPPAAVDTSADERTIRALDEQWSKTAAANDLEGTVSYYTDDASLLPPNEPMAVGKQAVRAVWASLLVPGASVSWRVNKVEVAKAGDLAYLIGTYDLKMKDAQGQPMTDRGKLLEIWKKQADGKWKVVADTFNSDMPLPPPPHPAAKKSSK